MKKIFILIITASTLLACKKENIKPCKQEANKDSLQRVFKRKLIMR